MHSDELLLLAREIEAVSSTAARLASRLERLAKDLAPPEAAAGNQKKYLGVSEIRDVRRFMAAGLDRRQIAGRLGCSLRHAGNLLDAAEYPDKLVEQIERHLISFEEAKRRGRVMPLDRLVRYIDEVATWRTREERRGVRFRKQRNYVTATVAAAFDKTRGPSRAGAAR